MIELRIPPLRERREEIPALVEFFLVKYAKLYRRPAARPSPVLIEALLDYAWPGNIRELENMMKRYVVLQEEALVLGELVRLRQTAAAAASLPAPVPAAAVAVPVAPPPFVTPPVAPPAPPAVPVAAPAVAPAAPAPPAPPAAPAAAAPAAATDSPGAAVAVLDDPLAETNGSPEGVDLQVLAKNAALRAEREAIDRALVRFRWNRRKAAQYLNVSYKTLLNKIKECGISENAPN